MELVLFKCISVVIIITSYLIFSHHFIAYMSYFGFWKEYYSKFYVISENSYDADNSYDSDDSDDCDVFYNSED